MRKVIASKYGLENVWETKRPSHGVSYWKGIMQSMEKFKEAVRIQVGSGWNTQVWNDLCCTQQPLKLEAPHIYEITSNRAVKVANCKNSNGGEG